MEDVTGTTETEQTTVSSAETPQETAQRPDYVTRDELDRMKRELEQATGDLLEQVRRQAQSMADKNFSKTQREISQKTAILDELLSDRELAETLGDNYETFKKQKRDQVRTQAMVDSFAEYKEPEPETEKKPEQPTQQKPLTPDQMMALPQVKQVMEQFGIYPTDPEFVHPANTGSFEAWEAKIENAVNRKNQRLAAQKPKSTPEPEPERTPAQVSLGTGTGPRPMTIDELSQELLNTDRNDRKRIAELREQIKARANQK